MLGYYLECIITPPPMVLFHTKHLLHLDPVVKIEDKTYHNINIEDNYTG